jgi:ribosomal-protein-alanine N-acetyltransferase
MSRIRPVEPGDARSVLELRLANRDYFQRWEPDFGDPDRWYTYESVVAWVGDDQHRFVIVDDGVIAGMVALTGVERGPFESAMISYFVDAARAGRGVASAAVAEAVQFGFGELGLHRLEAGTATANIASQRVLEHNRFTKVGLLRRHLRLRGEWVDHLLWERLAED